jgi:hypothetical protein
MKALIFQGVVRDVCEEEFPVHESFTWVECDETVKKLYTYDGTTFSPPPVPTITEEPNV